MDLEEESERSDLEELALQKNPYHFRIRSSQILHWKDESQRKFFFLQRALFHSTQFFSERKGHLSSLELKL